MENKHTNYIDSRTEKEREEDSKIRVETTTAVLENKHTWGDSETKPIEETGYRGLDLPEQMEERFSETFPSHISMNKGLQDFIRQEIDLAVKRILKDNKKEI